MATKGQAKKKRLALYDERNVAGLHAETVYDAVKNTTRYAVYNKQAQQVTYSQQLRWIDGETYSPEDGGMSGLLEKKTILLPSEAADYESEEALLDEIQGFIQTYMVLPQEFYSLAAHYVLLTWLGDCFPAVPYLRARGDTGTGKSRFLKAVGSLCYTPIFASGATTASPIFRIYEVYRRATFLFDEADWDTRNDEFGEVIKILNFGYEKGAAVLRSDKSGDTVEPRAYDVFGPKLLATRNVFQDSALESRCFTVGLRVERDLNRIPENIGLSFWDQARDIRNKLLMWRFRHFQVHADIPQLEEPDIHPRLRMIMTPMIMCREKEESRAEMVAYLKSLNTDVQERRSMDLEAVILAGLLECVQEQASLAFGQDLSVPVKDIMVKINEGREDDGEEKLSARKIHSVLKTRLNIGVKRVGKNFCVVEDLEYIKMVAKNFGIDTDAYTGTGEPGSSDGELDDRAGDVRSPEEPRAGGVAVDVRREYSQSDFLEEPPEPED